LINTYIQFIHSHSFTHTHTHTYTHTHSTVQSSCVIELTIVVSIMSDEGDDVVSEATLRGYSKIVKCSYFVSIIGYAFSWIFRLFFGGDFEFFILVVASALPV